MHGVFKLAESLHERGYNNTISRVSLRPWNADWAEVAESIWLIGQRHEAPVVVNIYAYSWGVGWGAVQLAEELRKRNIDVQALVSADGVYRHPNPLMRWQSLVRRDWTTLAPVITIPKNVRRVAAFHQTINHPQGHCLVRVGGAQIRAEPGYIGNPGMVLVSFEDDDSTPPDNLSQLAGMIARIYKAGPKTAKGRQFRNF